MVSEQDMQAFIEREFPQSRAILEGYDGDSVIVRYPVTDKDLRPGGTVAGPVMMGLADTALYIAILREIGLVALAVTTNLNTNFMRKPEAGKDLLAVCRLLKLGKALAVGEVTIYSEGQAEPVAHTTGTYSIPPNRN